MKKYLSAFVCGFGAGVLQIVPVAKNFSCCLIIPLSAFIALILDRKANRTFERIEMKHALMIGLMTGIYAAIFGTFFDLLITFITKNNDIVAMFIELQRMINNFPISDEIKKEVLSLFQKVRNDILNYGFSLLYSFSVAINNFVVNTIFGMIGGLIGAQIINSRLNNLSQ